MDAGQLPEEIRELYEKGPEGAMTAGGKRLFRTNLINKLFQKTSNGQYVLATDTPVWKSFVQQTDTKYTDAGSKGVPRSILLWQVFQGNERALEDAIACGDVYEKDGFFHYGRLKTGRSKAQEQTMHLGGGEAKVSVDEMQDLHAGFFGKRPFQQGGGEVWQKAFSDSPLHQRRSSASTEAPPKRQKALCDGTVEEPEDVKDMVKWSNVDRQVGEAKLTQERLLKDAGRYASKVRGCKEQQLSKMLKEVIAICNTNLTDLQHCQMFQDRCALLCRIIVFCIGLFLLPSSACGDRIVALHLLPSNACDDFVRRCQVAWRSSMWFPS